ncbi:MAG: hypothetical protein L0Y56_14970, partial [Nitrospira sp.]|nr:hypothetical protein [Nitrospira sp.]
MENQSQHDPRLARTLVLDELFDLTLYYMLRDISDPALQATLDELITVETKHLMFWQSFFNITESTLDPARRFRLWLM